MKCDKCGGPVHDLKCAAFSCELPPVRCAIHIDEQRHAALAEQGREHSKLRIAARAAYDVMDTIHEAFGLDQDGLKVHQDLGEALREILEETYWIYPGERRTVIVKARSHDEAEELVRKSPHYDGFPIMVHTVEAYERRILGDKDFMP